MSDLEQNSLEQRCDELVRIGFEQVSVFTGATTKLRIKQSAASILKQEIKKGTLNIDAPDIQAQVAQIISDEATRFKNVLGADC